MRLSWASEEHPVWGPYFASSRVRTHMTWQRSSVFLLDVRSSLRKKKKKKLVIKILGCREIAVFYKDLRYNI